ncbi:T9SS type A sorting domain-containing protein [Tamlana sp. 2_MG-2023]|uniref:T9SS type A sorting domain-containing protein n=1 Tax=unclassified Tamlana TaxID=2614803 RepID=UPI0026E1B1EF|nr:MULTISPECIES: T9SS type A sorting domain-containing protein [unclassified Tamlana]MDO6761516.1 T9SS type A sorting domain-containing protein [Tamlana sp. 2_MG-2023]MDO6792390.1 T9SS type A sorting domain-containing protein [Tamlana sp. 1_MG-2023]
MNKKITLLSMLLLTCFIGVSQASLKVTEIWPGNEPGDNLTSDWFEITNTGSTAWLSSVDADLYYDDDSQDPTKAAIIEGISQIQPGAHVIVIIGKSTDITEFSAVWSKDYNLSGIEIGFTDGSGLGGGGDAVTLFLGDPTVTSNIIDFQAYPNADANGGQSYDVALAAFSTAANANNAAATTQTKNNEGQSAIGSPCNQGPLAAGFDLIVTEIWPGNNPGGNLTEDWFEIKNNGLTAWVASTDGNLYYDDDSQDPANAAIIEGIASIQPGERVIVILGDATKANDFKNLWTLDYDMTDIQVGFNDGSGLGKNGDGVTLFLGDPLATANIIDYATYPSTAGFGGQSYDVEFGTYSTVGNTSNAGATNTTVNNEGQAAIASPGNQGPLAFTIPTLTITVDTAKLSNFLDLPEQNIGSASGVVNDPTDPTSIYGIPFIISDIETPVADLQVSVSSSDESVVPNANLVLTGADANHLLKITPIALGFTTITVTVQDTDLNTATYTINYAASEASVSPSTSRFYTGASDGSTGITVEDDYIWIGDDEDQTIRLYDGTQSGLPLKSIDFNADLGSTEEADLEGSFRLNNTIFWTGSTSEADRSVIFTTEVSGSGANSNLTYGDKYNSLHDDLVAWDTNNDHGLGANYFGLTNVIEIEALALAPNSTTTAYLGLRSSTSENKAIVIPVTNFTSLPGMAAGSATFGTPIFLDLNGRSLRSMECNDGGCVLIGGPFNIQSDFKLYTWTGVATDAPEMRSADLTALNTQGSFEGIASLPSSTFLGVDGDTDSIKLLVDLGATVIYNDGEENKGQREEWKKFRTDIVTLGPVAQPVIQTPVINEFVANHVGNNTAEFIEIFGAPFTDYSAYSLLIVNGEAGNTGTISTAHNLGTTDENGFWSTAFLNDDIENGTITLLLVENYTGTYGDDIDTTDNGVIDATYWTTIVDGIAISNGGANEYTYAVALMPNYDGDASTVGGASRIPNGLDTDSASDWVRNDFDGEGFTGFTGTPVEGESLNTRLANNKLVGPILSITEIWAGNDQGSNLTADWFEITNNGPLAWTPASGGLYFDDDSQDPASAVLINGITSIQPGESVIAIDDSNADEFIAVWGGVYNLTDVQIGTYAGAGLGGGGDTVTLWIGDPTTVGNIVDAQAFPDTASAPGKSYNVEKGAFSVIAEAAYFSVATAVNDANEAAVGSPGNQGPLLSHKENIAELNTVKVFPVPFNDALHLQLNLQAPVTSNVQIIDILGTSVYNQTMELSSGKTTLDFVSNLPSGIYILRIAALNKAIKIVKK